MADLGCTDSGPAPPVFQQGQRVWSFHPQGVSVGHGPFLVPGTPAHLEGQVLDPLQCAS